MSAWLAPIAAKPLPVSAKADVRQLRADFDVVANRYRLTAEARDMAWRSAVDRRNRVRSMECYAAIVRSLGRDA